MELSEKADVAAAYNLLIRLPAECESDAVPPEEGALPAPSGQVQTTALASHTRILEVVLAHPLLLAHTTTRRKTASPHLRSREGVSWHYVGSGPIGALHARARTLSYTRTCTRTRTATRTARHVRARMLSCARTCTHTRTATCTAPALARISDHRPGISS